MSDRMIDSAEAISSKDVRMRATTVARRFPVARARRLTCALAAVAAVGAIVMAATAATALAGECPNEQLRSENNSTRLPECRAYEMVTPPYTEGFPVENGAFSAAGAVTYISTGSFAGNSHGGITDQYVATRSAAGWTSTSLMPPDSMFGLDEGLGADALSVDFRYSLWRGQQLEPPADAEETYYLRGPDGSMTRIGDITVPGAAHGGTTEGASADLSHIVFAHGNGKGNGVEAELWEFVGTGNEGPPTPVSVDNDGNQLPGEAVYGGMSSDGRVIAFNIDSGLWARVGASATVAVSGSECTRTAGDPGGACNTLVSAPGFAGMSSDGSRMDFTTTQQLVNGDTDQTSDLYECDIPSGTPAPVGTANPCASLTEVSHGAAAAEVQSVVKVSEDGSHVYFTAKGVLANNLGTNDAAPAAGDVNLYVWEKDAAHPAGQITFVTKLESGIGFAPRTTPDGRYLLFSTTSRLVASDTDEAQDVYRYDAQTRTMLRISTSNSGSGGTTPGAESNIFFGAPMSADGSTVIFDTTEALSPADTDGSEDVYEWHEGQVSLISDDGGHAIGITPSGQDIFFVTGVISLSRGENYFDARIDGGFPASGPAPCSGETCQGTAPPQPQPPGISASTAFNGPGSPLTPEAPPSDEAKPKPPTAAQKLAKALKACRAKHVKKKRKACEKRARNTYRRAK